MSDERPARDLSLEPAEAPRPPRAAAVARLAIAAFLGAVKWLGAVAWLGAVGTPRPAAAEPPTPPATADEETAEQIERQTTKGLAAFRRGNHEEALTRMDRLEKLDPANPLPRVLRARVWTRTGKYAEALAAATAAAEARPDDLGAEALRFDLLRRLGRTADAAKAVEEALARRADDLVARTVRGLLHEDAGRRTEALADFDAVVDAYNAKAPSPDELAFVATAALRATRLSPNPADDLTAGALKILAGRVTSTPDDVDARLLYAELHQSKRGKDSQATAGKQYTAVLEANPEVAEARVGRARIAKIFYDEPGAVRECERALQTNPSFVPAMNVLAAIRVGDGDYDQADALWERARKVNPRDKEARAIRAARLWIGGDRAGFEALEKELLGEDPTYGALYRITSDLVGERQRRYDVAADLAQKAIAIDPTDDQAHVALGVARMNLGREDEALVAFKASIDASKGYADVVRDNFLEVLGVLETFVTTTSDGFVVKQHVSEADVMTPYLIPLLGQARRDLAAKYGFTPAGPIHVASFHRHDDFSVRSVGSPNLPALGVCFGKVITLDGPLARALGEFSWARTAWHEYAHVVTLDASKGQVPRWLTEGLSVHEEKAHKPQWGREMDRELFDRARNGRLLKMAAINQAFRGPDIMFAYFQGGLIADYIQETVGFEAIVKMLRRFADDVPTAKVFEEVLGIPLAEFDGRFAIHVDGLVKGWKLVPRWDDDSKKGFEATVAKDPSDATAWTRLGFARLQRGQGIDVGEALAKAKALAPAAPTTHLLEAELARTSDRHDAAKAAYERFLAAGGDDMACRLAMGRYALDAKQSDEAVTHFEAAKRCFPRYVGKGNPFLELAKLHEGAGRSAESIAELEAYAAIAQEDYAVRRKLAAWFESKKDDAKVAAYSREMIEISPFGAKKGDKPDLELHKRYALALERIGNKTDAAREWHVQILLLNRLPEEARKEAGAIDARLRLGALYLDLGRADDALEQALGALSLDPTSVPAAALKAKADAAGAAR